MNMMMDPNFKPVEALRGVPPLNAEGKSVAILLATYNGARFLAEQLDSIERQTHTNWRVYASDDGSQDGTLAILENYRARWGADRLSISQGPQAGHAENFMSLIRDPRIKADYYAYCDQDDIWLEDKLGRSISALETLGETKPALYGSSTIYINQYGEKCGHSRIFKKKPSFENAILQSIAGGNTMLINNKTLFLLRNLKTENKIYSHDWLSYVLVTVCGGNVYYDSVAALKYRQHGSNLYGNNTSLFSRFNRIKLLLNGHLLKFSESHIRAINSIRDQVSDDGFLQFQYFTELRKENLIERLKIFHKRKFHRQSLLDNLGIWVALILKKI
jgi:glycosyltransferase involved in cell wall biosynthesis